MANLIYRTQYISYVDGESLESFIQNLRKKAEGLVPDDAVDINFELSYQSGYYDEGGNGCIEITFRSPETEIEEKERKERERRSQEYERQNYLRLKAKFEGAS